MKMRSNIWKFCMVFGVVAIVLLQCASLVSALPDNSEKSKIESAIDIEIAERPNDTIGVIIELEEQGKEPLAKFDVGKAKSAVVKSQKSLSKSLDGMQAEEVAHHWIINAVSAKVSAWKINEIAAREDVKKVWLDKKIRLIEPVNSNSAASDCTDRLYLGHSRIPPYDGYLSEEPGTAYGDYMDMELCDNSESFDWGDYYLDGDITGTDYSYGIYFASNSSTTFKIEIIINGTTVATFPDLTIIGEEFDYMPFSAEITGIDPSTSMGDEVILRITKISGDTGRIISGTDYTSNITIPCIGDYGDTSVNAPAMWDLGYQGGGVTIAIIDSGIDSTHPDLAGKIVSESDFTDDGTTDDLCGHGTHCAGIATGRRNVATGIAGVAPEASLINAKVLNETGFGDTSWIMKGIEYAIEQNADILSISLGDWQEDGTGSEPMSIAVTNSVDAGYVVVAAAGNDGPGEATIRSPAVSHGAIAVAASDSEGAIVDFSSRGPAGDGRIAIDLAAPGDEIIAPNAFWEDCEDYIVFSGTSMSGPHVAGAAALLLQAIPGLTPPELKRALKNGADPIISSSGDGSGARVVYCAFDMDDIDDNATQRQLIENSENWLRVAKNPTESVLIIDDENYFGSSDDFSVEVFESVFEEIGYDVTIEESDETLYSEWGDYDIVVWSCGEDPTPIRDPVYKQMLLDYVDCGGHLLLESGYIASWVSRHGDRIVDRELRLNVLHAIKGWVYCDVGDLRLKTRHPITTTPNILPETINFTPTEPGDNSGDADAARILPDAVGVCNWSRVAYEGIPNENLTRTAYGLIVYEGDVGGEGGESGEGGYDADVREQGSGRLDVKDSYDALTDGIVVDSEWFVGRVQPGIYMKTFTVTNNNHIAKTVDITGSAGDAGDWMTLPASLTVPAGGAANFNAVMDVPGGTVGAYKGSIRVTDGVEEILIPVSLNVIWDYTKTPHITGVLDEDWQYATPSIYWGGGDWVYYTFNLPAVSVLDLSLDWTETWNDLDLILFDPNNLSITGPGCDDPRTKPETIVVYDPLAGNWTVAINAYWLEVTPETFTLTLEIPPLRGDVNRDGTVTPEDSAIALDMAVSCRWDDVADVSGDGQVTSLDALLIMQIAAGDADPS